MRRRIAYNGVVLVALQPDGSAMIDALGLPLDEDYPDFVLEAQADIRDGIRKLSGHHRKEPSAIVEAARLAVRRAAQRWSGKKPQVRVLLSGGG